MLYHEMLRLDEDVLLRETSACAQRELWATVQLLVRLAAVEERALYAPAGYGSMWDYCLGELDSPRTPPDAGCGRRARRVSSPSCSTRWPRAASA